MKYLNEGEKKIESRETDTGKVVCTDQRLIHFGYNNVHDISISSIDMISHNKEEKYSGNRQKENTGIVTVVMGVFCGLLFELISIILLGISTLLILWGIKNILDARGETYTVENVTFKTPSGKLKIHSEDTNNIRNIVHAVRAVENDQIAR